MMNLQVLPQHILVSPRNRNLPLLRSLYLALQLLQMIDPLSFFWQRQPIDPVSYLTKQMYLDPIQFPTEFLHLDLGYHTFDFVFYYNGFLEQYVMTNQYLTVFTTTIAIVYNRKLASDRFITSLHFFVILPQK